jgi:hypothetical protein
MAVRRDTRRRLEQWLKNPACEANVISAVAGVEMSRVAEQEGGRPTMGQSPFAIARGVTFESGLLRDGGQRLREALRAVGLSVPSGLPVVDLRLRMNGGPVADQDTACRKTREWLETAATDPDECSSIVASATLRVPGQPIMLPDGIFAIDALLLQEPGSDQPVTPDDRWVLRIGEVKSYPDRGGYTDSGDLASARAQAGAYRYALQLCLDDLGLQDRLRVSNWGFLVLSRPGANEPSVRPQEDLRYQSKRAERGFAKLREAARALEPFDTQDDEAGLDAVLAASTEYSPSCVAFCDRAALCRKRAESDGEPIVLGDDVARLLGPINLHRATELLKGATPHGQLEAMFVDRAAGDAGA